MPKFFKKFLLIKNLTAILAISSPTIITTSCTIHIIIDKDIVIRLFQTTDIHGYLMDTSSNEESTFQYYLAYIANQIYRERENFFIDDVLLVDGGDIYQGQIVSNFTNGAAIRAAIDLMKYDAVTLGNHEFDWGLNVNCSENGCIQKYDVANEGKYKNDKPNIPILASNLYYENDHTKRVEYTKDYVVVNKSNKKIVLIGYIPDYSNDIAADKIAPYYIDDNLESFNERVIQINNQEQPDMTIVMAHANPIPIANSLNHDYVQLVTGGHEHDFKKGIAEKSGIPYIQGGYFGQGYASAYIKFSHNDNTLSIEHPSWVQITSDDIKPKLYDNEENRRENLDKNILELSHFAWESIADKMQEKLGYIETSLIKNNKINENGTATSAGNWITTLFKESTDVDVAFYNSGGIRASFKIPEGANRKIITLGDIYTMLPFNNQLCVYEVNGKQLKQQLLNGFKNSNYSDQLTGLKFKYRENSTGNIEITEITLDNGVMVDMDDEKTTYKICLTNYSAMLDGSIVKEFQLKQINNDQTAPIEAEAIINILKKHCGSTEPSNFLIDVDLSERGIKI